MIRAVLRTIGQRDRKEYDSKIIAVGVYNILFPVDTEDMMPVDCGIG